MHVIPITADLLLLGPLVGPALIFTLGQGVKGSEGGEGVAALAARPSRPSPPRPALCRRALLTSRHNQRPLFSRPYFVSVFFPWICVGLIAMLSSQLFLSAFIFLSSLLLAIACLFIPSSSSWYSLFIYPFFFFSSSPWWLRLLLYSAIIRSRADPLRSPRPYARMWFYMTD